MSKQVQFRRGTTAQHATFAGAVGEVTVDTDKKTAVIHDGETPGGSPLATGAQVQAVETQVTNARTNAAATPVTYATLKERLDAGDAATATNTSQLAQKADKTNEAFFRHIGVLMTLGVGYRVESGLAYTYSNTNYASGIVSVSPGDLFKIIYTNTSSSNYYGALCVDDNMSVMASFLQGTGSPSMITNYEFTVPLGATKVIFTEYLPVSTYSRLQVGKYVAQEVSYGSHANELTVLCFNCGRFADVDGDTSDEEYFSGWKNMLIDSKYDIVCMSEFALTINGNAAYPVQSGLFDPVIIGSCNSFATTGMWNSLVVEYRRPIEYIGIISVCNTGGTQGESTSLRYALKFRVNLCGQPVTVYSVHLIPEGGITNEEPFGQPTTAMLVRAQQFADLIADATNEDNVIFCGDFNAQTINEYTVFTDAGYKLCNGGYYGDHVTLRDIYADNIILSPRLIPKSFDVITNATLSSDHYPLLATIAIDS